MDPRVAALYEEYRFRRLIPLTHDAYLEEPAEHLDWFARFERVDAEVDAEMQQRAQKR